MNPEFPEFLDIIDAKLAAARGVNLSKELIHDVYSNVLFLSKTTHARTNKLFRLDAKNEALEKYEAEAVRQTLIELKLDKLVVQLISFEYDCAKKEVKPVLFYAAKPASPDFDIAELYYETVQASIDAIVQYLFEKPPHTREEFWHDLNLDLESKLNLQQATILGKLRRLCEHASSEWFLPESQILRFERDVESELLERELAISIDEYGIAMITQKYILEYFSYLEGFMNSRISGLRKKTPRLNRAFELIHLEKQYHDLKYPEKKTTQFVIKRAQMMKEVLRERDERVPLAIEYTLAMGSLAEEKMEALRLRESEEEYFEHKSRIKDKSRAGQDIIFFIPMDSPEMDQKNLERLKGDSELIFIEWFKKESAFLAFVHADPEVYRILIEEMENVPPEYGWQIPVMRRLLIKAEEENKDENVFRDKSFTQVYGSVLRKAYLSHMPWYVRPLLKLRLRVFENLAFQAAKKEIDNEQASLRAAYLKRAEGAKKSESQELNQLKARVDSVKLRNELIEILDFFYFQQKMVPTISNVLSQAGRLGDEDFKKVLRDHNFQVFALDSHGRGAWEDRVLVHPMSQSWRVYGRRLMETLDEIIGRSMGDEKQFADQVKAAKKLRVFIEKKV